MDNSPQILNDAIAAKAHELRLVMGISQALPPLRIAEFRQWLKEGKAGTMSYLQRSLERRANPELILPGVKSIITVAENYFTESLPPELRSDPSRGIIASYAWGKDYHEVLLAKLEVLAEYIKSLTSRDLPVAAKCYADTGHILERDYGARAGLGFIGKNTMLIQPKRGSYFFLGEILTTLELEPTAPDKMPSCGTCARCLQACPTHALPAAYILDSNLCISYLTIEYKGVIDRKLRPLTGNHIFGCDDCQECCPWNRFATPPIPPVNGGEAELNRRAPKLTELAELNEAGFQEWFAESPVLRSKYSGFMRNVAIALGNWGTEDAVDALEKLSSLDDPLIRLHAAWALGQCNSKKALQLLSRIERSDTNDAVRQESADAVLAARSRPANQ
ncbi:tRNA epoxyqueuosine(34) reductase QueG [bacterium]|nr:tRNA epoxyqueuosine(34) reductase QueG [bacterium]MBU1638333.1 tRNA epoxyqueuosine(34) reductase QueG [bacterium]